jgi:hypothetical protein
VQERAAAGEPYDPVAKMAGNAEWDASKAPGSTQAAEGAKVGLAAGGCRGSRALRWQMV